MIGKLICFLLRRHKWGRAQAAQLDIDAPKFKACRRCSLTVAVKTRKPAAKT